MTIQVMQKWQREHFTSKVRDKMAPLLDAAELSLKSIVANLTENAEFKLAKKIGADTVIDTLTEAEQGLERARRKAKTFFSKHATSKTLKAGLKYSMSSSEKDDLRDITPEYCRDQLRDWASSLAKQEAEKTPQGKKLVALQNIETAATDSVMEANIPSELLAALSKTLGVVGITWQSKVQAIEDKIN